MNGAQDNVVRLAGRLTLETVTGLFAQGAPLQNGVTDMAVDFTQVEAVDSSAVSLMLVWLRGAQKNKVNLSFVNVPDNLLSLAGLYGVTETLSLRTLPHSGVNT